MSDSCRAKVVYQPDKTCTSDPQLYHRLLPFDNHACSDFCPGTRCFVDTSTASLGSAIILASWKHLVALNIACVFGVFADAVVRAAIMGSSWELNGHDSSC